MPLRVHQDIVLTSQMFVDGDDVILLPAATRYEQEGGGTSTTTERQIAFSPQVADPLGEARSEWRIFAELAGAGRARRRPTAFAWADNRALRAEIADLVPMYAGIEDLEQAGDAVQYGGRHLCPGGRFPTPTGRARFSVVDVAPTALGPDEWYVSTRRGKQFNSMVLATTDPLTGAGRDAVYIDSHDAGVLGVADGDADDADERRRDVHGPGQARAPADADAAGALAGGQRPARRPVRRIASRRAGSPTTTPSCTRARSTSEATA